MATSLSRGTTVVGTTVATWANTSNVVDGGTGSYGTWVNAVKSSTGTITVGGYSFPPASTAGLSVSAASASFQHFESSTSDIKTVTCQLQDSSGNSIGTAQTVTETTVAAAASLTFTAPTAAQLVNGLRTLTTVTHTNTNANSATFSLDYIDVTVTYTMAQTGAATGHGVLSATAYASKFTFSKNVTGHGVFGGNPLPYNPKRALRGTGALSATRFVPAFGLTDDFAFQDTAKWSWNGTSSVNASLQLRLVPTSTSSWISSVGAYDMSNSTLLAQMVQHPNISDGTTYAGIFGTCTSDPTGNTAVGLYWSNGSLWFDQTVAGVQDATSITFNATKHKYLRIIGIKNTANAVDDVSWETSPDGVTWTCQRFSARDAGLDLTSVNLQIFAGCSPTATSVGAGIFDNVNIYPAAPLTETLVDNFNAGLSTSVWTANGTSNSVVNGELQQTITPTGSWITSNSMYDLRGSYVSVELTSAPIQGLSEQNLYGLWATSDTGFEGFWYPQNSYAALIYDNQLLFRQYRYGTYTDVTVSWDTTQHKFVRIRESGGTIYWETSPDTATWTVRRSNGGSFVPDTVTIMLFTQLWGTGTANGIAKFDNVGVLVPESFAAFPDTFSTQDTTDWVWSSGASVSGGQLVLSCDQAYDGLVTSVNPWNLWGSAIYCQFVQIPGANLSVAELTMAIGTQLDINGVVDYEHTFIQVVNNLVKCFYTADNVTFTQLGGSVTYDSTKHRWFRIRHDGLSSPTMYYEVSPNLLTWTTVYSGAPRLSNVSVLWAALYDGLQAAGSPVPATGLIDNFNTGFAAAPTGHGTLSATARATLREPITGHGALTATPSGASGRASPHGAGALAATAVAKQFTFTKNVTGHGVLSATAPANGGAGAATGHGVLSATAVAKKFTFTKNVTGHGVLSATTPVKGSPAAFVGHGVFSATVAATQFVLDATPDGHGVLSATVKPSIAVAPHGNGLLSPTVAPKFAAAAALAGQGVLSLRVEVGHDRSPHLSGVGTLTATATATKFIFSKTVASRGALTASATAKYLLLVPLPGVGTLSATALSKKFTFTAPNTGHGVLSAGAFAKFARTSSATGHGALTETNYPKLPADPALAGRGVSSATLHATKFIFVAAAAGHGALSVSAKIIRLPHLAGRGILEASRYPKFSRTAALPGHGALRGAAGALSRPALTGHGALSAVVRKGAAGGVHGHGVLSATAHSKKFILSTPTAGHGLLSVHTQPINANQLTFFTVTGRFIAASEPNPAGTGNSPIVQPVNALVTFTPRLLRGQQLFVSDFHIAEASDAQQIISLLGGATGGTFTLSFAGDTTAVLPWNATPSQVQAALVALPTVGVGNVLVTASLYPQSYDVQFIGGLQTQELPAISGHGEQLLNVFGGGFCEVIGTITAAGSGHVVGDAAISLPPLTARIWNGVLSTIDYADTPGFELTANTDILNLPGELIYDVTFQDTTFNEASQYLAPFAFIAPTDDTPVSLTSPALQRLPYALPSEVDWTPPPINMEGPLLLVSPGNWRQRALRARTRSCLVVGR